CVWCAGYCWFRFKLCLVTTLQLARQVGLSGVGVGRLYCFGDTNENLHCSALSVVFGGVWWARSLLALAGTASRNSQTRALLAGWPCFSRLLSSGLVLCLTGS